MLIRVKITAAFLMLVLANIFAGAQPLSSGTWSKFSVGAEGVYRIDYALLKKAGLDPDQTDPRKLQLYSNGNGMLPQPNAAARQNQLRELAIFVSGEDDGKFDKTDFILFYGKGADEFHLDPEAQAFRYSYHLYADKNYYFLTAGAATGKRMAASASTPGNFPEVTEFNDFARYENEQFNVLKSGRSWYGEQFSSSGSITVQFKIPGIVSNAPVHIVSRVMAQSYEASSSFKVFFNEAEVLEHEISPIPNSQYGSKGAEDTDSTTVVAGDVHASDQIPQNIRYQYTRAEADYSVGYLDNFLISFKRKLAWFDAPFFFSSGESLAQPASSFVVEALPEAAVIWDVTDPFEAQKQTYAFATARSSFSTATNTLKRFAAFLPDKAAAPAFESIVPNQRLSALAAPDLLIITHPLFKSEAQRLAGFRSSHNNLNVLVVTPQEIYNEYSGGKQDITALRDFIRELSKRGGTGLDNVLLFGRCSYDYKNRIPDNTNFVPTYESINSLEPVETYSSDDYYGFLETSEGLWPESPAINYTMDIGVGRISVVTAVQAKDVVDKLLAYDTHSKRFGAWRNKISFVADDGDANLHQSSANDLATTVESIHPEMITRKIYLDQFRQIKYPAGTRSPEAKDELDRAVDDGSVIVNFTGHGSEHLWMDEQILDDALVESFRNANRYPLFVTATCEFGRHDDPFQISNAERLLFLPAGGGISLVTTARPVQAITNSYLNKSFYDQLFIKSGGAYRDLGTIFRFTKNNSLSGISNRNFSLLGDPSLHLALAEDDVVFTEVKTSTGSDTLKALSNVTAKGEIREGGLLSSGFNGIVSITVLDKPAPFVTRGDENAPFSYSQWSNALFRGNATVNAGKFEAEFILPGNIDAAVGTGKISAYAYSSSGDASGAFTIKAGGLEPDVLPDNDGPEIALFMGDTTFINGGIASPNTTLVVHLQDASGITSSSFGGGTHDLKAVLDDSLTFILNGYYNATLDDFRSGEALFPLKSLQKGHHSIVVEAFDTYGNSSISKIEFVITDGNLVISTFYNFPNPFAAASSTRIGFTHNRPGEDLEVELVVVDLTGRLAARWLITVPESFTDVILLDWDGTSFAGNKLGSGVYIGKVSVRSLQDGSKNQLFTKLIIGN